MQTTERDQIGVFLVDDEALVRAGLRALIEQTDSLRIVGESNNAHDAIRQVSKLKPDLAIVDIRLPGLSGIDAIPKLKKASPRTRLLMATQHEAREFVLQAMRSGADGYLTKSSDPRELLPAIESIYRGETYVTPRIAATFLTAACNNQPGAEPGDQTLAGLTAREREVFQMIAIGRANKEIARTLDISLATVKKHRENLQRKLDCHSPAELARLAIREGLLEA